MKTTKNVTKAMTVAATALAVAWGAQAQDPDSQWQDHVEHLRDRFERYFESQFGHKRNRLRSLERQIARNDCKPDSHLKSPFFNPVSKCPRLERERDRIRSFGLAFVDACTDHDPQDIQNLREDIRRLSEDLREHSPMLLENTGRLESAEEACLLRMEVRRLEDIRDVRYPPFTKTLVDGLINWAKGLGSPPSPGADSSVADGERRTGPVGRSADASHGSGAGGGGSDGSAR